ncbi:ABC transporter ATP-binding protein [Chloroflexota bacterium]
MTKGNADGTILKVENISLSFGGIQALADVSFELKRGEILGIIGPNGAGKTTLLNCISGFYSPQKGEIYYEGKRITHAPAHSISKMGIARTFQNFELFTGLNTVDNIMTARHLHSGRAPWWDALYFGRSHKKDIEHRAVVEDVIDFFGLQAIRKKVVGTLSYGWRKRVDLARALALEPKVLLLDEPVAGLSIEAKEEQTRYLLDMYLDRGITIVIIEHDMAVVTDIAMKVVALDFGRKIAEGSPKEVMKHPTVVKAYWGKRFEERGRE